MIEKNEKFPGGLEAMFLLVALMALEYLLLAAFTGIDGSLGLNRTDASGMVTLLANAVVFTALMEYKAMSYRELFHSSSGTPTDWPVALPAVVLLTPLLVGVVGEVVNWVVGIFPLSTADEAMFSAMNSGSVGSVVLACVMAPFLEEMLFRGVILRSFLQQYSRWIAILGSAMIFGVAHMNIYQFFVGLALGTVLGWLYQRTRSLLPCITLHIAYNGLVTAISLRGIAIPGGGSEMNAEYASLIVLTFMMGLYGLHILRRVLPASDKP